MMDACHLKMTTGIQEPITKTSQLVVSHQVRIYGKHLPASSAKLRHMVIWRAKSTRVDDLAVFTGKGRVLSNVALLGYLVRNMD